MTLQGRLPCVPKLALRSCRLVLLCLGSRYDEATALLYLQNTLPPTSLFSLT